MKKLLLTAALASLSACATATPKPQVPCEVWLAAEASWAATSQYVAGRLAEQRAAACYVPPPAPTPTQSLSCPEEAPTPTP